MYDYLGWLLSVTARPTPAALKAGASARNYYLPLLSLSAKWCLIYQESSKAVDVNVAKFPKAGAPAPPPNMQKLAPPNMLSIAWWPSTTTKGAVDIYLGASIGANPWRPGIIVQNRQHALQQLGFKPKDAAQLANIKPTESTDFVEFDNEGNNGFGKCAET